MRVPEVRGERDTAHGDVTAIEEPGTRFRLRCGDYRVIFRKSGRDEYKILQVGHRREIYRGELLLLDVRHCASPSDSWRSVSLRPFWYCLKGALNEN